MSQKKNYFPTVIFLIVVSLLLFILSRYGFLNGFTGFFENGTVSLQRVVFSNLRSSNDDSASAKLREENMQLLNQLTKQKELERENQALRDQFNTPNPSSSELLPAAIVGILEDKIIIDKGEIDGLKPGNIVVYKDNLIGRIVKLSERVSVVDLLTSKNITLTAKGPNSESLGVVRGDGTGIILDNVVLSEKLEKGNVIVTKGDIDENGSGFPPDLVVGKITTINKKPSSLFQTADVESLIDFNRMETVFIITTNN